MPDIFSVTPGAVVAIAGPGIPMDMFLDDWGGYLQFKSIITGFEVSMEGGVQFLHTLRDFIYIYTFGERIGNVRIRGLSFAFRCEDEDTVFHGLSEVHNYYLRNRLSARADPVILVLGGNIPFYGFLSGLNMEMSDTESVVGSFSFNFNTIPNSQPL